MKAKPFEIDKKEIVRAYRAVRSKGGAAGVDGQTIKDFEQNLKGNLYKLWNRMSSGSYIPPPVRRVEIPKAGGGKRGLGIPTISDRIAQTVIKQRIQAGLESIFDEDSYGYRPGRSAHDALERTRQRCWQREWVIELDIKGYFDSIRHEALMHMIERHVPCAMSRLYLKRWLQAGVMHADGHQEERSMGTPQGGVVSPLLANLYLHYVFDRWIRRQAPWVQFERYADDIVCHCQTRAQAEIFLRKLTERLSTCGLTLHPEKTRLVYCGRYKPKTWTGPVVFDFLGYQFRPRTIRKRDGTVGTSYLPAISPKAVKKIMDEYRTWRFRSRTGLTLKEVAYAWNARLRGWLGYYGRFYRSAMHTVLWQFDVHLSRWWSRKYAVRRMAAMAKIYALRQRAPGLFAHWV